MQQQILLPKTDLQYAQHQQNVYIGVIEPLDFPYNLFINVKDVLDPDRNFVYCFVYILGAKKIAFWATYNKKERIFNIAGGCRYKVNNLLKMTHTWEDQGNKYVANAVKNRFEDVLAGYLGTSRLTYSQYLRLKFILAYYNKQIKLEELKQRYPEELDKFLIEFEQKTGLIEGLSEDYEETFNKYLENIGNQISTYENSINRVDLDRSLNDRLYDATAKITQRFYDTVKKGEFQSDNYYTKLKDCPTLEKCQEDGENCEVYFYGTKYFDSADLL